MKRPLAYITAAWDGEEYENTKRAARYCRAVYEAGFSPVCPTLFLPLFLNDNIPDDHKNGIDMSRNLLRRASVLVVCGYEVDEAVMNDRTDPPPIKEWRAEQTKLTTAKYALCERYYALQDDVRSIEQLRKGAENIMREDVQERQPRRAQDIDL